MISPSYTDLDVPGNAQASLLEYDHAEIAGTLEIWARKWGRELAKFAVANPTDGEGVQKLLGDIKELEDDNRDLRRELSDLTVAIKSAIESLEAAL